MAHGVLAARLASEAELHVSRIVHYAATLAHAATATATAATAATTASLSAVSADVVKEAAWSVISAAWVLDSLNDRLQNGWLAGVLIVPVARFVSAALIC